MVHRALYNGLRAAPEELSLLWFEAPSDSKTSLELMTLSGSRLRVLAM
jgi:hypothetical protein